MAGRELEENKRRLQLGIGIAQTINLPRKTLGNIDKNNFTAGSDTNIWQMLRRSKELLSMRTASPKLVKQFDFRKEWNQNRAVETVLDLFPALKYSYSTLRGKKFKDAVNILSNGKNARIGDIAQSHSIRLDPVDSQKQLYKYRQRIHRVIEWAYANNLVPVMMTLTLFHRWHPLSPLCNVLKKSWLKLFGGSKAGMERKKNIELCGYIRRMEETFNDGDSESSSNGGWHPHYHVILIIPRNKLQFLSDYESELKEAWCQLVRYYYKKEFGEDIPSAYYKAFKEHGLMFSRYKSEEHACSCGHSGGKVGELLEVPDGRYLTKITWTDEDLYGVKEEKGSKTPFDLLRGEVTANLADLWCEYALATKKVYCFSFSNGLQKAADDYYYEHHKQLELAFEKSIQLPPEEIVARIAPEDYRWLYRNCQIGNLLKKAKEGFEAVKKWLKESFNIEVVESAPTKITDAQALKCKLNPKRKKINIPTSNFIIAFIVLIRKRSVIIFCRRLKCLIRNKSPPVF